MSELSLGFPDELVRAIATQTARVLKEDGLAASPWLNIDEAADYLRIPKGRLQNLTAARQIKFSPQGKSYIYNREWLDEYARRAAQTTWTEVETVLGSEHLQTARQRWNAPGPAPGGKS
jgi:excisionase family DNA binding protein